MKTHELLDILEANPDKSLLFEYSPGKFVGANYHITEVKHIHVDSVDCGAGTDAWNETIIQLWESPSEINKTTFMSSYKALGILKKVGRMKPFHMEAEVKFEYGNKQFHDTHLFVDDYEIQGDNLIFKLAIIKTDCKAKATCGVPETTEVLENATSCAPESGCC